MIILNPNVGVAPGTTTMTLGAAKLDCLGCSTMDPYADFARLRGLGGLGITGAPRWGLVAFAGLATFAGVLGYKHWRQK